MKHLFHLLALILVVLSTATAQTPDPATTRYVSTTIAGDSPIITNCTFEGNDARHGSGPPYRYGTGGAVHMEGYASQPNNNPQLINCSFSTNTTRGLSEIYNINAHGGAVYNAGCNPTIINCSFGANKSFGGQGGALYNASLRAIICDSKSALPPLTGAMIVQPYLLPM